jgi:hypothetical protein
MARSRDGAGRRDREAPSGLSLLDSLGLGNECCSKLLDLRTMREGGTGARVVNGAGMSS